jgi:long-chain acyl-CoA synthetase
VSAVGEHNLARLVELAYERRGNYPSLLYEDRWHASGELFERSRRLAGGLAAMGVAAGDRVAVSMANCPEVGIAYHALWRAGAVVTPATFLPPEADLQHVLGDSGAVAVITTPEFVPKVRAAAGRSPQLRHVICAGPVDDGMTLALADLEQAAPAAIVPRADDDLAALLYTGGTTGRAKGVMLSHRNLHYTGAAASAASHVPGINRGSRRFRYRTPTASSRRSRRSSRARPPTVCATGRSGSRYPRPRCASAATTAGNCRRARTARSSCARPRSCKAIGTRRR